MVSPISFPYSSYRQIAYLVRKESLRLFLLVGREWKSPRRQATDPVSTPFRPAFDATRTIAVLSKIVQRSGAISRYLATLAMLDEEREGRIEQRLDLVFSVFTKHRIDLDTFYAWVDADLRREMEAEMSADYREVSSARSSAEPDPNSDIAGMRPVILVAELCCDLGIAAHVLPVEWLDLGPADLRLLCARAAASYIRPGRRPLKPTRLRGHSHPRS